MAAYLYATGVIHDAASYETYRAQVPAIIAAHGGRYLVRGGATEVLEGGGEASRQVILEFPDMAALKAFYDAPEYAPLKRLRQAAATMRILAVEGI